MKNKLMGRLWKMILSLTILCMAMQSAHAEDKPTWPSDEYSYPAPELETASNDTKITLESSGKFVWNSNLEKRFQMRPGFVYSFDVTLNNTTSTPQKATGFLTTLGMQTKWMVDLLGSYAAMVKPGVQTLSFTGIRNTSMEGAWDRKLGIRIMLPVEKTVVLQAVSPVRMVLPLLNMGDHLTQINATTKSGEAYDFPKMTITNAQVKAPHGQATILYGAAHIQSKPKTIWHQSSDGTGVILVGENKDQFTLVGAHVSKEKKSLQLIGNDDEPGLLGGKKPEIETFHVRFVATPKTGQYKAAIRIVTQAINIGIRSEGKEGEPLKNLYYIDIPIEMQVQ